MALPTYDKFIEPVLRHLATRPGGDAAGNVHDAAAEALGISELQRQNLLPSGQAVYKNRAGWAHDRLKRAGLSSSPKRGFWILTDDGRAYARSHAAPLSAKDVEHLALGFNSVRLRDGSEAPSTVAQSVTEDALPPSATASPDDRLEQALIELREATASDLIESLLQVLPGRFEVIVLDVLHRLGYGASRSDLRRVGGTGDAGIDGVISLDKLGLEKVYVQAKRWKDAVGRPELQAFYGALAGQKAKRGIFITTSSFTNHAIEFADSVDGVVLIDGIRLVHLMIDQEVGVSSRMIRIPKVDVDYFDET